MLVEDDNNLREIYEARLLAEGHEIVSAKDGEEALALAVNEKPDLIISDVMMPKISGFDMLDILRSTPETKDTKVIMMTALSQAEDKQRADKLGADRYLVKSQVTLEDVAKVAQDVLAGDNNSPVAGMTPPATEPTTTVEPLAPATTPIAAPQAPVVPPAEPVVPTPVTVTTEPVTPAQVAQAPTQNDTPAAATPVPTTPTVPATETPEPAIAATEPAAAPISEPNPTAETTATPATPVTDIADNLSQTTADEEAAIESQINEIFAQDTPATAAQEEPVVSLPPVEPEALAETPAPSEAIAQSIEVTDAPEEPNDIVVPAPAADTAAPVVIEPQTAPETPVNENQSTTESNNIQINNKKTIQPINDLTKGPDLNELLKKEVSAAEPTVANSTVSPTQPNTNQAASSDDHIPPTAGTTIAPNDIAL